MIEFKAFVKLKDNIAAAQEYANDKKLPESVVAKGGIKAAFEILENEESPKYLLVELSSKDSAKAFEELDELANIVDPGTKVIVCGAVDELSFYKELIGMGIEEYLLNPVKTEQLEKVISRKNAEENADSKPKVVAREDSRVIAVCGTRGGAGASSLALNLAAIFAAREYPTAVLDLDPEFGTIPLMADVEPSRGLVDAFEKPERVDSLFLDRVMVKVTDHLFVTGAEKQILEPAKIDIDAAKQIIEQLTAKFAYVIVDVSRVEPYAHHVLKNFETIIVTEQSISGLRDSMRIYDLIKEQLGNEDIFIASSRVGMSKKFETAKKDFESGLGRKIDFSIPFEADYYGYSDSGKILAQEDIKKSAIMDAYQKIAAEFMPEAVGEADSKGKKKGGGLGGLFAAKK